MSNAFPSTAARGHTALRMIGCASAIGVVAGLTVSVPPTAAAPTSRPNAFAAECKIGSKVPRGKPTQFGASLSTSGITLEGSLQREERRLGRLPIVRMFDPTVPSHGAWSRRKSVVDDRTIVASFREKPQAILTGNYDARIREWFAEAPRKQHIYWSYYHEPEYDLDTGVFSKRQYRRAWRHISRLAAQACNPRLHSTWILTGWTAGKKSGRNWRDYWPGGRWVDVVGWDPYNSASKRPKKYVRPRVLFRDVMRVTKKIGKPYGIAETGSQLIKGDHGKQRAKWLRRLGRYFERRDALFVTYYQSYHRFDYRLLDRPSKRAWRSVITR